MGGGQELGRQRPPLRGGGRAAAARPPPAAAAIWRRRPPPPEAAAAAGGRHPEGAAASEERRPRRLRLGEAAAVAAAAAACRRRRPCGGRAAAACGRRPPPNSETGTSTVPGTVHTWADRPQTWHAHRCLHMGPAPGEKTGLPAWQIHALENLPNSSTVASYIRLYERFTTILSYTYIPCDSSPVSTVTVIL